MAGDHDHCDLDLPMMMSHVEGDVPPEPALVKGVVPVPVPVSVPQSSTLELECLRERRNPVTKKNVKAHDRAHRRTAQETPDPRESLQKVQGTKTDPTSTAVFVDDAVEEGSGRRDEGA